MTTHNTNHSNKTQQHHHHQTNYHLSHTSSSISSASPPSPLSSSPPFFQTSLPPSSTTTALHSTLAHRTPGHSPIFPDSIPSTISTFDFSSSTFPWSNSTSRHPPTPELSSISATLALSKLTTPASSAPRRLSSQQPEQGHPLSLPNSHTMVSTTITSHPSSLNMPSPMSSSPSSAPPLPLSASASSYTFGNSQNQNSRPLLDAKSLSTSHRPPMLARPRSQSSDPIPGATAMTSSSSAFLLTSNNNLNPINSHLSSVAMDMSRRPSLPANHPLLHHHHPMERQRSYDPRRQPPGFYLQQQALLQEQFELQQQARRSQAQVPQAPVVLERQESVVPLQRPALTPLSPSRSISSLSSTSTVVSSLSSSSISSTLSSSTLVTISTAVRHPLWQLDCKSCKTTLCEQAMLGHQAGDPNKQLFSTNLAIGVLRLPDRPVSIQCPCKFHLFACASCGTICGYKLVQACTGCETDQGNGHFWIFYANEVVSHWRRIRDGKYADSKSDPTTTATSTLATTAATTEKETVLSVLVGKGAVVSSRPPLMADSMAQFEKHEEKAQMDKQSGVDGGIGEVDVVLAKCHLSNAEGEEDDGAEGRLMYWDDLLTWQSQTLGYVGR